MDNLKCPLCNKKANEPINLRCEHHPCFQCASQIISVDQQSALQTRYRIICPLCHKKTITYDLRHLIINATEQDQDLFVTSKFVSKKPQVVAKRETDKIGHSKRNSFQGIINICPPSRSINLQCKKHPGSNIQYFCGQCCDKNQIDNFLCSECLKVHKHRVINVRDAAQKIEQNNQKKRQLMIPARKKYLQQTLNVLAQKKQIINNQFQNLYKQIADEFKVIYHYINQQYQLIKKQIKSIYLKQSEQVRNSIAFAQRLRQNLIGLQKISAQNRSQIQTQVNYSICLSDIEFAIEAGKPKLNQKLEIPKVAKKTSVILGSTEKLFEILTYKSRPASKPATPTNSSRNINYNYQSNKLSRNEQRQIGPEINMLKQNFNLLSPKNYLCTSKLNI